MSNYSDSSFSNDENTSWQKTFNLIPSGSTVLDVGCSTGTFGKRLIDEKQCEVDGIELNKLDADEARKVLRSVYEYDIERDDITIDNKYDVVFMGDVIEHLAQPTISLKKLQKLLKPKGILVFSIPNITHMSVRLMILSGKIEYGKTGLLDETHLHFYNSNEILRVFNEAGFQVEKLDYTTNDLPKGLVDKELKKLGLSNSAEFMKLVRSTNGAAYQFVGVALVSQKKVKPPKLKSVSPKNIVQDYFDEFKKEHEENLNRILADRDRIQAEKDQLSDKRKRFTKRHLKRKTKVES